MEKSQTLGRIFIAMSLVVFAVQHFMYAGFVAGLVPAWIPGRLFWAYFVGVAFVAAAIGAVVRRATRPAGTLLGVLFFLFVVTLHLPRIATHSRNGNEWTSGFVALAMCGGAWVLASASPCDERKPSDSLHKLGRYFFAVAILAFGVQHFVYARFGAGLGPPWFPGRPLWAYLTGVALLAAGVAILVGKKARVAAALLGTMLFLFFLLLHVSRVTARLHDPGPWTSGFEVLALSGGALLLAGTAPRDRKE